jgi:5-(carboxyamino)imidazole ribonucleotide mutase
MPEGVPVATVALNAAKNAGILAAQMLATADPDLLQRIVAFKKALERTVLEKAQSMSNKNY